jgi:hypothetical protein
VAKQGEETIFLLPAFRKENQEMIDTKLIAKAKPKSQLIEAIDASWRDFVDELQNNVFKVPFKGSYQAFVEEDALLVEGFCGLLWIDKLYYQRKTYLLKEPVKYYPFKIYGAYDKSGSFEYFTSRPEMGFHYLGLTDQGHSICTGDIQYLNPDSFAALKEATGKIISSFRMINLESLGTVLLPDNHATLKTILSNKEESVEIRFKKLIKGKFVQEIL